MSRSLHNTHRRGGWVDCPFLPDPARRWPDDRDCGVPSEDHPGGQCPHRTIGAIRIREGDIVVSRHVPRDYGRRYCPALWTWYADRDNRLLRRDIRQRLNRFTGAAAEAIEAFDDDPTPLRSRDRGIAWKVY